jgi:hypothetical protein
LYPVERPSVVKRDLMPSMGHNVAEVMFLDINAKELDLDLKKKTFLLCTTLSKSILQVGGRGKRKVFSELKAPPAIGANNYSREAFVSL